LNEYPSISKSSRSSSLSVSSNSGRLKLSSVIKKLVRKRIENGTTVRLEGGEGEKKIQRSILKSRLPGTIPTGGRGSKT